MSQISITPYHSLIRWSILNIYNKDHSHVTVLSGEKWVILSQSQSKVSHTDWTLSWLEVLVPSCLDSHVESTIYNPEVSPNLSHMSFFCGKDRPAITHFSESPRFCLQRSRSPSWYTQDQNNHSYGPKRDTHQPAKLVIFWIWNQSFMGIDHFDPCPLSIKVG